MCLQIIQQGNKTINTEQLIQLNMRAENVAASMLVYQLRQIQDIHFQQITASKLDPHPSLYLPLDAFQLNYL